MSFEFHLASYLLGIGVAYLIPQINKFVDKRRNNKQPEGPKFMPMENVVARVQYNREQLLEVVFKDACRSRGIMEDGLYRYSCIIIYDDNGFQSIRMEIGDKAPDE